MMCQMMCHSQMRKKVNDFGMIIWIVEKEHNREAKWLIDSKNELENEEHLQESVVINVENVKKQCRKVPNCMESSRER